MRFVTLQEISEQMGLEKSACRRYLLRRGFTFSRRRTEESRGQLCLVLKQEDATKALAVRKKEGI